MEPYWPKGVKRYTFNQADPVRAGILPTKEILQFAKEFGDTDDCWAYGKPFGNDLIREWVAEGMKKRHGTATTKDDVLISTGSVAGGILTIMTCVSLLEGIDKKDIGIMSY